MGWSNKGQSVTIEKQIKKLVQRAENHYQRARLLKHWGRAYGPNRTRAMWSKHCEQAAHGLMLKVEKLQSSIPA